MQVNTLHITIKIFNNKKRLLNIKKRSNFALIIRESRHAHEGMRNGLQKLWFNKANGRKEQTRNNRLVPATLR